MEIRGTCKNASLTRDTRAGMHPCGAHVLAYVLDQNPIRFVCREGNLRYMADLINQSDTSHRHLHDRTSAAAKHRHMTRPVRTAAPGHVTTLMPDTLSDIIFLRLADIQVNHQ